MLPVALLSDIASQGWGTPTLIQEKAIPLALEGKDIVSQARTGSGKTAAYSIPVIQKILIGKRTAREQAVKALILAPSRDLCKQIYTNVRGLTYSCSREVSCVDLSGQVEIAAQRPLLMEKPDIVISTPRRLMAHLEAGNINLKHSLEMLVVDEADLIFSFGHEEDFKKLVAFLPKIYQAMLMSATLTDEVLDIKQLVLHNAITLKLKESQLPESDQLSQYYVKCRDEDKFLLLYCMFKLNLIRGKTIIFVTDVDRCFRLKLFLEQFSIRSCVLNSLLPAGSRMHIIIQFNCGLYDIIIAAGDSYKFKGKDQVANEEKEKLKQKVKDVEFGVSRGIDFQNVSNVINFDFPGSTKSTFTKLEAIICLLIVTTFKTIQIPSLFTKPDAGVCALKPYQFKMSEIEGFRYRAKDAMRAVTKVAIRDARMKELKQEIMNSTKLKTYFEDNPRDMQLLRHDKVLHPAKVHSELKNVPEYLVPRLLKDVKPRQSKSKKKKRTGGVKSKKIQRQIKKRADPLNSFTFKSRKTTQ
ncbi:putative ATP-dependent RNA helicase DDX56 [Apostichopus japonicus]|uniref:RNA helicase n=1 Tax=Stichopus japonicus TaxID=307972 RepID=A0A2G8LEK2_STIJA|nr:putative ATP-dependent RNA helicase DDX56 [Apostichopus japonicus]